MAEQESQVVESQMSEEGKSALSAVASFLPSDFPTPEQPKQDKEASQAQGEQTQKETSEKQAGETKAEVKPEKKEQTAQEQMAESQKNIELGPQAQDKIVIENELVGKVTLGEDKESVKFNLENPEVKQLHDYITKTTGIDSLEKFEGAVNGWRKDAQLKTEAEKARMEAEGLFQKIPPQLQNAIIKYNRGDDWLSDFRKSGNLDYSKNPDDFSKKELINSIYQGKFSSEDWKNYESGEEEYTQLIKRIDDHLDMAKEKFSQTKSAIESTRAKYVEAAEREQKAFTESIPSSEAFFIQTFPDAAPSVLEGIKKEISDGGIHQLYFNNDGSLKEDALVKHSMAKFGKGLLDQYVAAAKKAAVNEHIEAELAEKKGSVRTSGGSGSGTGSTGKTEAQTTAEFMKTVFGGNPSSQFKY